ncbi:MAG: AsmA-like C-terminal region-containing protein [Pseudomonadota bacterium]
MRRTSNNIRYVTAAAVAFAILLVGLSATLLIDNERIDFNIDTTGVVAAPRDEHHVAESTLLNSRYGISLYSGKITQKATDGKRLTGKQAQAILEAGQAMLELRKGAMIVGSPLDALEQQFSPFPPLISALRELKFATLQISQGRMSVMLPSGRNEWLFNVNMVIKPRRSKGVVAQGTAVWRGHKIQIDVDAGLSSSDVNQLPAKIAVSSPLFSMTFDGQVGFANGLEFIGNTVLSGKDTRQFARSLRIIWPEWAGISDFQMSSPMTWTSSALTFEKVRAKFDENEATGIVAVKGTRDRAQITGTLAFETLDLTKYVVSAPTDATTSDGQSWWNRIAAAWSEPLIRHFDADLRMSAKEVVFGDQAVGNAAATVALKDGKLSAQLAKLSFAGGSGSGQVTIDQSGLVPKTSFHGKFVNVPLGDLTSSLFGHRGIEGRATITADLRSQGLDHQAFIRGLDGDLRLDLGSDGIVGFDLKALANKSLSQADGQSETTSNTLIGELLRGTTRLAGLTVDFGLKSGQLLSKKFEFLSSNHRLRLSGHADLVKQTIDFYGALQERAPATTATDSQSGPAKEEVREGGRSIRLTGSFTDPNLEVHESLGPRTASE